MAAPPLDRPDTDAGIVGGFVEREPGPGILTVAVDCELLAYTLGDELLQTPQAHPARAGWRDGLARWPSKPRSRDSLPAVPLIETLQGPVTLSVEARDQLLDRIRRLESGRPVVRAFERAGLSGPVVLDLDGKHLVVEAISLMLREGDVDPQLRKLWEYLRDELTAAE